MLGNMLVGGVLIVFAAIISFSALKWFPEPYLWIFLTRPAYSFAPSS